MKKHSIVLACSLLATACGSNIEEAKDCVSADSSDGGSSGSAGAGGMTTTTTTTATGGSGGGTVTPPEGCDASPYAWGDEVLFVCANKLPMTESTMSPPILVGIYSFTNYRTEWIHVGSVCVRNVGPSPLDGVQVVTFDVVDWTLEPVKVQWPWPNDGKICANVPMTIGAEGRSTLTVSFSIESFPDPAGNEYQIEIPSESDVVIDGYGPEPIGGEFPVQSEVVTIVGQ